MKKERIQEIARQCFNVTSCSLPNNKNILAISEVLVALPEFQEPKWIAFSERLPEIGQAVWITTKENEFLDHTGCSGRVGAAYLKTKSLIQCFDYTIHLDYVTHWMPRELPEPPAEEESEQVRELRMRFTNGTCGDSIEEIIEIVKRHKKGKSQ